jgi:NAD(P)-dependent dehydrogenase (short-subunit alcohol dehydrogenase family)
MRELSGKVAVITGGGSGIGRATCLTLAGEGMAVAVCDIEGAAAESTSVAVRSKGGTATTHPVDVADLEAMRALVPTVLAAHGAVDVVVNNAGIGTGPRPTAELPLDEFHRTMDINFWGTVHGSIVFLPHLLGRPTANLVNVASNAALMAYTAQAAYCSSKFAVRGFTETLRMELRSTPVRVTLVCPGATRTPIMSRSPVMGPEQRRKAQDRLDAMRGAASPEKVAAKILRAIRHDDPRALIGVDTAIIDLLVRTLPGAYSRILHRPTRKLLESLGDVRAPVNGSGASNRRG